MHTAVLFCLFSSSTSTSCSSIPIHSHPSIHTAFLGAHPSRKNGITIIIRNIICSLLFPFGLEHVLHRAVMLFLACMCGPQSQLLQSGHRATRRHVFEQMDWLKGFLLGPDRGGWERRGDMRREIMGERERWVTAGLRIAEEEEQGTRRQRQQAKHRLKQRQQPRVGSWLFG